MRLILEFWRHVWNSWHNRKKRHAYFRIFSCTIVSTSCKHTWCNVRAVSCPIYNITVLVQILIWHRSGNKPLSEPIMVIGIYIEIEVKEASLVPRQSHHTPRRSRRMWWDSWVTGDATLTANRCINFNCIMLPQCILHLCKLGCVKAGNRTEIALNPPLWRERRQTIVTATSLVTHWKPLWRHSDSYVTKSWQYVSMKKWQNNDIFVHNIEWGEAKKCFASIMHGSCIYVEITK